MFYLVVVSVFVEWVRVVMVVGWGVVVGCYGLLIVVVLVCFFGCVYFGLILGVFSMVFVLVSVVGLVFFLLLYGVSGFYCIGFFVVVFLLLFVFFVIWIVLVSV